MQRLHRASTALLSLMLAGHVATGAFAPPASQPGTAPAPSPVQTHAARDTHAVLPPLSQELITRIETHIAQVMKAGDIPGMTVAIGRGDDVVWTRGFGLADLEQNVPATEDSVYRLASISKPLTAVAAMWLVEQGKLSLDAEVRSYVPEFPDKGTPITLRQLLCHQGGIRHYKPREVESTRHYTDSITPLAIFKNDPLIAAPGTTYLYSTYGYVLAGGLIERAGGKSLIELIADATAPAGAKILADDQRAIIPHRVRGYQKRADGVLEHCELADTSNKIAGGGMCARPPDLVRIALSLAGGRILNPESLREMWTPNATADGTKTTYGLGWQIATIDGKQRVMHSGAQPGTATCLVLFPEAKVAVAVFCNLERAPAVKLAQDIAGWVKD
jgi:CubicO group peptidase (beta-lactamase class C family)